MISGVPGDPGLAGVTWLPDVQPSKVNFSVYSAHATRLQLCLLDSDGNVTHEFDAAHTAGHRWTVAVTGISAGQRYAWRAHGPWKAAAGHRFDADRLLVDPYSRAVAIAGDDGNCLVSVVADESFDWGTSQRPNRSLRDSVIYELHVKGFTRRHPDVPEALRGTYLALIEPPVIAHLKRLGITAVELMPCAAFVSEPHLTEKGLRNYWGYNSLSFFAPHPGYAVNDAVKEFKTMVRGLHDAGIEVIVDVVFNHTAEGGPNGPTMSYRGLDNASWYWLDADAEYLNYSGCGNTLALAHKPASQLVLDCMRYWVSELRVDGFRFDLAPVLGREGRGFNPDARLMRAIRDDATLADTKLIAEPWDVGPDGYCVGQFPPPWSEWNDRYRDTIRGFWRGDHQQLGEFAQRLSGSSDLYQHRPEGPATSINFVTSHDGFSLLDLVSYLHKHNEANGEDNRDGHSNNLSWNCGVEGDTHDAQVRRLRLRHRRSLLTTLLLSQGTPMLLAGDESGRTQGGNNNAYCQDNDTTWHQWAGDHFDQSLVSFVARLIQLRLNHPVFRRQQFFKGRPEEGQARADVIWLRPDGQGMSEADWNQPRRHALGMLLTGNAGDHGDGDDAFLLLFNGGAEPAAFHLAGHAAGIAWRCIIDTAADNPQPDIPMAPDALVALRTGGMVVLEGTTL